MSQGMRTLLGHWLCVPMVVPGTRFPAAEIQVSREKVLSLVKPVLLCVTFGCFFPPISR